MKARPAHSLLEAIKIAPHTESNGVRRRARKTELRHRDGIFGGPAERVDSGRDVPDSVPASVLVVVVVDGVVTLYAARTHAEFEAAAAVVIRIDHHDYLIRRRARIASCERGANRLGIAVERADE